MSAVDDAKKYLSLRPPMENKTIFALHPDVLVGGLLDEIERLREALRLMPKTITDAANEIERLRVDLEEYRRDVERLREALESFSCECETEDDCCAVTGSFCGWEARAALKEGE